MCHDWRGSAVASRCPVQPSPISGEIDPKRTLARLRTNSNFGPNLPQPHALIRRKIIGIARLHVSGLALMDHLGAEGLLEETCATTVSEMVLIDMAVTAFANAMRVQSMVGNTSLIIEGEMFAQ